MLSTQEAIGCTIDNVQAFGRAACMTYTLPHDAMLGQKHQNSKSDTPDLNVVRGNVISPSICPKPDGNPNLGPVDRRTQRPPNCEQTDLRDSRAANNALVKEGKPSCHNRVYGKQYVFLLISCRILGQEPRHPRPKALQCKKSRNCPQQDGDYRRKSPTRTNPKPEVL